jgi:hypothetical protein
MSGEAEVTHGHQGRQGQEPWSSDQKKLAGKIAVGFVAGFFVAGVIGPIVLTVVIGLLQGYHRF